MVILFFFSNYYIFFFFLYGCIFFLVVPFCKGIIRLLRDWEFKRILPDMNMKHCLKFLCPDTGPQPVFGFILSVQRSLSLWGVGIEQRPEPDLEKTVEPVILGNFALNFCFVFGLCSDFFWVRAPAICVAKLHSLRSNRIISPTLRKVWWSGPG